MTFPLLIGALFFVVIAISSSKTSSIEETQLAIQRIKFQMILVPVVCTIIVAVPLLLNIIMPEPDTATVATTPLLGLQDKIGSWIKTLALIIVVGIETLYLCILFSLKHRLSAMKAKIALTINERALK